MPIALQDTCEVANPVVWADVAKIALQKACPGNALWRAGLVGNEVFPHVTPLPLCNMRR